MRFSARRSVSPSPVRRSKSTFGLNQPQSELGSDEESSTSSGSSTSDSYSEDEGSSLGEEPHASSSRESLSTGPRRVPQSLAERRYVEDTVAAIRLRTRHHDPWDEWERATRVGAFRTARKDAVEDLAHLAERREAARVRSDSQSAALHAQKMAEVESQLATLQVQQKQAEAQLLAGYKERDRLLWERIESVIKFEEAKVQARLDEERKVREAEEAKKREEALKLQQAEERKLAAELKIKKEQEEFAAAKAKEEQDRQDAEKEETARQERLKAEEKERSALGLTTSDEDWAQARNTLSTLKSGAMKTVKSTKELKSIWMKMRREIVPKIGQLTNDQNEINRISQQLVNTVQSAPSEPIYFAVLSSLAKAILLQAETEVTAEKRAAIPLALVTVNMITSLQSFAEVFLAKLVQRSGGWPIPIIVPSVDDNGQPWQDDALRAKAHGYKRGTNGEEVETVAEYTGRVAGLLRLYFHILKAPVTEPLPPMFQMPRYWTYFARMMGSVHMLESAVAPQVLYAALDVGGDDARQIWGSQWNKMLALLYSGVTAGLGGGRLIGGTSPEGKAARVRVQIEIERIMGQ